MAWPPNQTLNKASNVQFTGLKSPYFQHKLNDEKLYVPDVAPTVAGTLVGTSASFEPGWNAIPPYADQALDISASPIFDVVTVDPLLSGTSRVLGNTSVRDRVGIADGTAYGYSLPYNKPAGAFRRAIETTISVPDLTNFNAGLGELRFFTTYTSPTFLDDVNENAWLPGGSGFNPGAWSRFNIPAANTFPVADNTSGNLEWVRWAALPTTQPSFTLLGGGQGTFAVDWSLSVQQVPAAANLELRWEFIVAPDSGSGPIIEHGFGSHSGSNLVESKTPNLGPAVRPYQTLTGRGYVRLFPGDHIGFWGRVQSGAPGGLGLWIKNLSVCIRRLNGY
jgi:hypothetical protein